jgi:DNA-binding beta-propeller fold protein YncE
MGTGPVALAFDGANLWVSMTSTSSGWVQHVRPSDGAILSDGITIAGSRNSGGLAYDGKALYVASSWSNFITRIDLSTRGKTSINVGATLPGYGGSGPWGILFDGTYVWVANQGASTVQRLGISSNGTVTSNITIPTAGSIRNFVFDGAAVWGWGPGNSSGNIYSWQTSPLLTKF